MSGHASEELGILATMTAAIEATQTDITDIDIEITETVCNGTVRLNIPLDGVKRVDDARFAPEQARVVGGDLQIDLGIEIDIVETGSTDGPRPGPRQGRTDAPEEADERAEGADTDGQNQRSTAARDEDETVDGSAERVEQAASESHTAAVNEPDTTGEDESTTTGASGERDARTGGDTRREEIQEMDDEPELREAKSDRERARYRDPEELAAVYDENATFKEMKAELGVDVTPQTVRKYMIEYGIHEPKPRPDRMLESIRASEFDLMNDDRDEQSDKTEDSEDPDS